VRVFFQPKKPATVDAANDAGPPAGSTLALSPHETMQSAMRAISGHVGLVFALSAAINILYLAPSIYMLQVYDRVLVSSSILTLIFLSLALAITLAALSGLDGLRARILSRMGLRLDLRLSGMLIGHSVDARGRGRTDVTAMRDLDTLRQTLASPASATIMDLPWTPLYILVCFVVHFWVGMAALGGTAILLGLAFFNERASRDSLKVVAEHAPAYFNALEADMRVADTARAIGLREPLIRRRSSERVRFLRAQMESAFVAARYSSLTKFFRLALQSGVLGLGAYLAIKQEITPGAIIACTILTTRAMAPIEQIIGAWRQVSQGRSAFLNLEKQLSETEAPRERTALPAPNGPISVEGVTAKPPGAERPSLFQITLRANPGDIVGIVGPSGAGKSTLARVLGNAAIPEQGHVRIDGARYADWDPDLLSAHIGYLPQNVDLMNGTVAENISRFARDRGRDAADVSAEVIRAAKAAGAHDMILRLPMAYETPIGAGGRGLSSGQSQRVGLARALFGAPRVLVLDEPNAHLDAEGEAALVDALLEAKGRGAISFVVAHRAGLINVADKLLVLNEGRLVQYGPREQVAAALASAQRAPVGAVVSSSGNP
jgi:ATP-binding cassette subfamily C protein